MLSTTCMPSTINTRSLQDNSPFLHVRPHEGTALKSLIIKYKASFFPMQKLNMRTLRFRKTKTSPPVA